MRYFIILSLFLFSCASYAQWIVRYVPIGNSVVVSPSKNLLLSSASVNSIYFGDITEPSFRIKQFSQTIGYMHSFVPGADSIVYAYESIGGNVTLNVSADTFNSINNFTIQFSRNVDVYDLGCGCLLSRNLDFNNVIATQPLTSTGFLASVYCSDNDCPASDTLHSVIYTRNGRTFLQSRVANRYVATSFAFPKNSKNGFLSALGNYFAKTSDSGKNFVTMPPTPRDFYEIHFLDTVNGWGLTKVLNFSQRIYTLLYYTPDGGDSWLTLGNDSTFEIYKLKFLTPTLGYALRKRTNGNLYTEISKTIDGGQTWSTQYGFNGWFYDLIVIDSANVAANGIDQATNRSFLVVKGILLGLKPTPSDRLYTATPQPNPTANRFTIPGVGIEGVLSLVNASGRVVRQESFVPGSEVDISSLPKGLYLFRLVSEGAVTQGKVVRE